MEREVRAAETEAIFRDVNETLVESQAPAGETMTVLCECSDDTCAASIVLDAEAYERVRSEPTRFIVRPGHVTPDIEVVVEENADYWLIEKVGIAAEIAEETDPRPGDA